MGAPFALVPYIIYFARKHRLNVWRVFDVLIPGVTLAHAFGRVGCLGAGCCYGRPTGANWGVKLHSDLVSEPLRGVFLHPTQIYEALGLFLLFLGLLWTFKSRKFDGQVILTYFFAYPMIRSTIEIFRGDLIRGFVIDGVLSTSQFISILFLLGAGGVLVYRLRQLKDAGGRL